MDAELYAIYQALRCLVSQDLLVEDVFVFVDSQVALKQLQRNSLTGGQQLCYKISTLCKSLAASSNRVTLEWVPGHHNIRGNKHADRLARARLLRQQIGEMPASLSYVKRKLQEEVLEKWKKS